MTGSRDQPPIEGAQGQDGERFDVVMLLEPDQLVGDAARPVPRASLSGRTRAALWALRVFVLLVR